MYVGVMYLLLNLNTKKLANEKQKYNNQIARL